MVKRPRLFQRSTGWYGSQCLVVIFLVSSAAAQKQVLRDPTDTTNVNSDIKNYRKKMRELREGILRSSGGTVMTVSEETADNLPLFGVSHEGNQRNLKLRPLLMFEPEENTVYAIGRSEENARENFSTNKDLPGSRSGGDIQRRRNPHRPTGSASGKSESKLAKSSGKNKSPSETVGKGSSSPGTPRPPRPPNSPPTTQSQKTCTVELNLNFLQLSAIPPALFVNTNDPDEQVPGTRYVYNDGLRDRDSLDELVGSKASGICTRTQARVGNVDIGLQLGQGQCQFTYVLRDSKKRELVFTASGDVVDSLGGVLSVSGGSRTTLGAFGEIELLPVNLDGNGKFEIEPGDFFLDPLFYTADARIYVPCDL